MSPRHGAQVTYSHPQTVEWGTPQDFFDALDAEFGFTLDVAASHENTKVPDRYFTIADNGLEQDWMRKAYETGRSGSTVVCLVPARTDTRWWWDYAIHGQVRFFKGRLSFTGGSATNPESHNAPFPMALVVFGLYPADIIWASRPDRVEVDTLFGGAA